MSEKKIWFIGYSSKNWFPVSLEGWMVTLAFFLGMAVIGMLNAASNHASVTFSQVFMMVMEFSVLVAILYYITRDHVDKRY